MDKLGFSSSSAIFIIEFSALGLCRVKKISVKKKKDCVSDTNICARYRRVLSWGYFLQTVLVTAPDERSLQPKSFFFSFFLSSSFFFFFCLLVRMLWSRNGEYFEKKSLTAPTANGSHVAWNSTSLANYALPHRTCSVIEGGSLNNHGVASQKSMLFEDRTAFAVDRVSRVSCSSASGAGLQPSCVSSIPARSRVRDTPPPPPVLQVDAWRNGCHCQLPSVNVRNKH